MQNKDPQDKQQPPAVQPDDDGIPERLFAKVCHPKRPNQNCSWSVSKEPTEGAIPFARVHQIDDARVGARRVNITLGYIKRAAGKKLPELPCRVDEMTECELAIFKIGAEAVGTLQFIAREIEALETRGDLLPQLSSSELARRIQERAVEIRKAGNDSGNERDQQFIEGGVSALEVLADDIEDGTFPVSSSERRCGECGHDGRFFKNGRCHQPLSEIRPNVRTICACKCVVPAAGAGEQHEHDWYNDGDLLRCYDCTATESAVPTATTGTTDGFDTATAHATTHEGPQSNLERHAYQEHPLYPNYCAFAVGNEDYCKREPDSEVHLSDDVDQHGRRIPFVAPTAAPLAAPWIDAAAKEIADWITQTTPLAVGNALRSSIQRIMSKHCAAPVAAESEEAETEKG